MNIYLIKTSKEDKDTYFCTRTIGKYIAHGISFNDDDIKVMKKELNNNNPEKIIMYSPLIVKESDIFFPVKISYMNMDKAISK